MKKSSVFQLVLSLVVLLGVGYGAYRYLSGREIVDALQTFNYLYAAPVLALSTLYLVLKGWRFVVMLRPVCDLPSGTAFRAYVSGEGATLLPGGVTARLGLFKQAGVPVSTTSAPLLLSSLLDQVVFIAGALVAAIWFPEARGVALTVIAGLGVLGLSLLFRPVRRRAARLLESASRKVHLHGKWQGFAGAWSALSSVRVLGLSLGLTALAFALKIVALDLCLRGMEWTVPYPTLFAAFMLPTLLGRLSPLPAGVGVTEAAMVGVLVAGSGITPAVAFAAVALFRVATVLFDALLGTLVFFFAWHGEREAART